MKCLRNFLTCGVLTVFVSTAAQASNTTAATTVLMPFAQGSITDLMARDFAEEYSSITGQPAIVVNRLGAQGAIAGTALANSSGDGLTIMFTSSSLPVLDPLLKKDIPYDPIKDFTPICTIGSISNVVNVAVDSQFKTLTELITAAKAAPGKLTFAYTSSNTRLAGELFQHNAGIQLTGVPYKSSATALTEVSSGLVNVMFIDSVSALPFYQGNKLRPLAVLGETRTKSLPDVPTAKEQGVYGHNAAIWFGLYATAKTSKDIVAKLVKSTGEAVGSSNIRAKLERRGVEPMQHCGEAMTKFQKDEISILRDVLKKAGIEPI